MLRQTENGNLEGGTYDEKAKKGELAWRERVKLRESQGLDGGDGARKKQARILEIR
jgi:hypothetical protein